MQEYNVEWSAEIDANNPEEAAKEALDYILKGIRSFVVTDDKGNNTTIDLSNDEV